MTTKDKIVPAKKSFDEELQIFKPSVELIPDEYENKNQNFVEIHIFRNNEPYHTKNAIQIFETMKKLGIQLNENNNIHNLDNLENVKEDLNRIITQNSEKIEGLVLIFIGSSKYEGSYVINDDQHLEVTDIWSKFTSTNCPILKYKPKSFIFYISKLYSLVEVQEDSDQHFSMAYVYDIPVEADMLIIYKQVDFNNKTNFFNEFCNIIEKFSKKFDLIELITNISIEKSPPIFISTLTRRFFLIPNNERGHYLQFTEIHNKLYSNLNRLQSRIDNLCEDNLKKKQQKIDSKTNNNTKNKRRKQMETKKTVSAESTCDNPKNIKATWKYI